MRKLAITMIVASTAMAGAIHSGAQAAEQIDCNSGLTQIAIMSEQGSEGGISPIYAHCVPGALQVAPAFMGTTERAGVAGRPAGYGETGAPSSQTAQHAWPDQQSYPTD